MKKLNAVIALLLAAVLTVIAPAACAENTDAYILRISDPRVVFEDEIVEDYSGLAAHLSYIPATSSGLHRIVLELFSAAGSEGSAFIQLDGESNLSAMVNGMDGAYNLNMDALMEIVDSVLIEETGMSLSGLISSFDSLENWDLPDRMLAMVQEYLAGMTVTALPDEVTGSGITLTCASYSGEIGALLSELISLMDEDALVGLLLSVMYPELADGGFAAAIDEFGVGIYADFKYCHDESGNMIILEGAARITENGVDTAGIEFSYLQDYTAPEGMITDFSYAITDNNGVLLISETSRTVESEDGLTQYSETVELVGGGTAYIVDELGSYSAGGSSDYITTTESLVFEFGDTLDTMKCTMVITDPYFDEPEVIEVTGTKVTRDNGSTLKGVLKLDLGYISAKMQLNAETVTDGTSWMLDSRLTISQGVSFPGLPSSPNTASVGLYLYADPAIGAYIADLMTDGYSGPAGIRLALEPAEESPESSIYAGTVSASFTDHTGTVSYIADVDLSCGEIDASAYLIEPGTAVDVLTMDDAATAEASMQLDSILRDIYNSVITQYPDLLLY